MGPALIPWEHLEHLVVEVARAVLSLKPSLSGAAEILSSCFTILSGQVTEAIDPKLLLRSLADALSGGRVVEVRERLDELYGRVVTVVVNLPAREALELWLKLARAARGSGWRVAVEWRGENNLSEEELVNYAVRVKLETGMGPRALPGFSAVEAVREARGG